MKCGPLLGFHSRDGAFPIEPRSPLPTIVATVLSITSSSNLAYSYLLLHCLVVAGLIDLLIVAFGELLVAAFLLCVASNLCGWA